MTRNRVISLLVGLVIGAGGGLGLNALLAREATVGESPVVAPTTVTTTTLPAGPVWLAANETVVGSAVVVPQEFTILDDEAVLSYELHTLSPTAGLEEPRLAGTIFNPATTIDLAEIAPIFPAAWTLVTAGGEFPGKTANPRARTARFDVPEGTALADVESLRLDGYRIALPVNVEFELAPIDKPSAAVAPTVTVSVVRVVPQSEQTILQVAIEAEDSFNTGHLTIEGVGPAWRSSVREAEGRPRYNMRYAGTLPPTVQLRARGFVWVTIDDVFEVELP